MSCNNYDWDEEEEDSLCPMCLEELDETEKNFKPCTCGYQMCRFCWHHIKENLNGKCPNCRQDYEEENYTFVAPDPEEVEKTKRDKRSKEREKKTQDLTSRKQLANLRVIQRNLVYITNLSAISAKEDLLRRFEYFGQYGKIAKVVVNRHSIYNAESPLGPSVSAYVTYHKREDAARAIMFANSANLDGRQLKCSFGTTKYCTYFLRHLSCSNPDCMYLHEVGDEKDSFTKEEMASGKHLALPDIPPLPYVSYMKSVLPPPTYASAPKVNGLSSSGTLAKPAWNVKQGNSGSNPLTQSIDLEEWPTAMASLQHQPQLQDSFIPATQTKNPLSTSLSSLPPSVSWAATVVPKKESLEKEAPTTSPKKDQTTAPISVTKTSPSSSISPTSSPTSSTIPLQTKEFEPIKSSKRRKNRSGSNVSSSTLESNNSIKFDSQINNAEDNSKLTPRYDNWESEYDEMHNENEDHQSSDESNGENDGKSSNNLIQEESVPLSQVEEKEINVEEEESPIPEHHSTALKQETFWKNENRKQIEDPWNRQMEINNNYNQQQLNQHYHQQSMSNLSSRQNHPQMQQNNVNQLFSSRQDLYGRDLDGWNSNNNDTDSLVNTLMSMNSRNNNSMMGYSTTSQDRPMQNPYAHQQQGSDSSAFRLWRGNGFDFNPNALSDPAIAFSSSRQSRFGFAQGSESNRYSPMGQSSTPISSSAQPNPSNAENFFRSILPNVNISFGNPNANEVVSNSPKDQKTAGSSLFDTSAWSSKQSENEWSFDQEKAQQRRAAPPGLTSFPSDVPTQNERSQQFLDPAIVNAGHLSADNNNSSQWNQFSNSYQNSLPGYRGYLNQSTQYNQHLQLQQRMRYEPDSTNPSFGIQQEHLMNNIGIIPFEQRENHLDFAQVNSSSPMNESQDLEYENTNDEDFESVEEQSTDVDDNSVSSSGDGETKEEEEQRKKERSLKKKEKKKREKTERLKKEQELKEKEKKEKLLKEQREKEIAESKSKQKKGKKQVIPTETKQPAVPTPLASAKPSAVNKTGKQSPATQQQSQQQIQQQLHQQQLHQQQIQLQQQHIQHQLQLQNLSVHHHQQFAMPATSTEVQTLEKQLASATKEMQELEAKLQSLRVRSQEYDLQ